MGKKGGSRAKAGGGGKGGKGGGSGGPAWLNRKPWETDLWKEFPTPASTTTTDAFYGDTTIESEADSKSYSKSKSKSGSKSGSKSDSTFEEEAREASPLYGIVPNKQKRTEAESAGSMED